MSRAVIFKTKGKLDLRSLTVFGMNAKPETTTPIGYFGTGLKYAVAVLARNAIPVTFWIQGKKWTIEVKRTSFRDKKFDSLILKRHSTIPKTIDLPFTTEFAKNWGLWQAFRELESNTRDEKGETGITQGFETLANFPEFLKDNTIIQVESEAFVQEYFDRDKTFLPDGLTERNSSERVQCFLRKSKHIYYRSIRIMDLEEPSENTYNILSPVDLTEDRTAASEFNVKWEIQNYIAQKAPKEIVERAVTAPSKTFERGLSYEYTSRSDLFLDAVEAAGESATHQAQSALKIERPSEPPKRSGNWVIDLISAIKLGKWDEVQSIIDDGHRGDLIRILDKETQGAEHERREQEATDYWISRGSEQAQTTAAGAITGRIKSDGSHITEIDRDDEIPF